MTAPAKTTHQILRRLVEQPEASVDGDWYVVSLAELVTEGFTHIEVHYDTGTEQANDFILTKESPA